jgi:hypothetical protein
VLAAVPAFAVLVLAARGRRIGIRRAAVVAAGTVVTVIVLAAIDLARPAASRTHLGRFAHRVLDGEAGSIVQRKLAANWAILTSSPWTLLVPGGGRFRCARPRPPRALARLVATARTCAL